MSVHLIPAAEAVQSLGSYHTIIDARSESEWAHDHLPGAQNWPSLRDEERVRVGTLYKQVSAFEAQKIGAALVARNIAAHIEREVLDKPRDWRPLIYCWRGGKRSNALALVLGQIGFRVGVIEGGYKAFRKAMLEDLAARAECLSFRVICGPTGTGKTRLLHALGRAGAQVLDLEALACHRSSVLGAVPGQPQPSQKRFESLLWDALRHFRPEEPVYVEAESKKVGNVFVPEPLIQSMRRSPCVRLEMPLSGRVALLLEDYPQLTQDVDYLCRRLEALTVLRGREQVEQWQAAARSGAFETLVRSLLALHYDPGYERSTAHNFAAFATAPTLALPDPTARSFDEAAAQLLRG